MTNFERLSHDLDFVPVTSLDASEVMKVREIRNQVGVRKNMYTDHEIGLDEHLAWIEGLRSSNTSDFFAVYKAGELVGGAGISAINQAHKRADWAFYLSENWQGKGVGASVEYHFINHCFDAYDLHKLNCEVLVFNAPVIRMHQKFGFQIEGTRRAHIFRDGQYHDAVLLGITRPEWDALKAR